MKGVIGTVKSKITQDLPEGMQEGKRRTDMECRHGRCLELFENYHGLGCLISVWLGNFVATENSTSHRMYHFSCFMFPSTLLVSDFHAARSMLNTRIFSRSIYRYE